MSRIYQEIDAVGFSSEDFKNAVTFLKNTIREHDRKCDISEEQVEEVFFFQDFFYFVMNKHSDHRNKILKSYIGDLPIELKADELIYAKLYDNYAGSYVSMDVLTRALALSLGIDINLEKDALDNRESLLKMYFSPEVFEDIKHRVLNKKRLAEAKIDGAGYTEEIIDNALSSVSISFGNYKKALTYFDTKGLFESEEEKAIKLFPFFIPLLNALKEPSGISESVTPRLRQGNLSNLTFLIFDHLLNFQRLSKLPNASARVYYTDVLKATLTLFGEEDKVGVLNAGTDEEAFDQLFLLYKTKFGEEEFQIAAVNAMEAGATLKEGSF